MFSHMFTRETRKNADPRLTLHDLLQLHLQGLDGSGRVVTGPALYPVDGQPTLRHGGHVVILQVDDAVGVFDHGAVVMGKAGKKTDIMLDLDGINLSSSDSERKF